MMETWLLSPVLSWSLWALLLTLPGSPGAGTPSANSTDPVTDLFYSSGATKEVSHSESGATSTSSSSESLSPSQRNILLTHAAETRTASAANFDSVQTNVFTETSSMSPEATNLSTEPLTSSFVTATEASRSSSSDFKDSTNKNQMLAISHALSQEDKFWLFTEDENLPRNSPDTTLRLRAATASETGVHTDRTYTTTISRIGERTLLSVTSSSNDSASSAYTEDSKSHQPPSTWGIPPRPAETEDYTHVPSQRTNTGETTAKHTTGSFSDTRSPVGVRGTLSLTGKPNASPDQHISTSPESSDSIPPLRVTESSTNQSETPVSSTPPFTLQTGGLTDTPGTDQGSSSGVGTSTETTTQNQEGTETLSSQTSEDSVTLGLTAAPSTFSSSTSEAYESSTHTLLTGVLLTTKPVVTERLQPTEENTFPSSTFTTNTTASTAPPLPTTPPAVVFSSFTSDVPTEATLLHTLPSSAASTVAPLTSTAHSTLRVLPSQTQGPSTGWDTPTKSATIQIETSAETQRITTTPSQYFKPRSTPSAPASTEAPHTTRKQPDGGATEQLVTTTPPDVRTTQVPPRNPCVSNPCMNGGVCVSYKGPEYTCQCQQAWTGPNCNQDMDECEQDPCPVGSSCVNTRGSFSCECPLGFDLEDGRACTRAKTFLGTFSFNKDNPSVKSAAMHEIQREILQLLNVSLSVLRGYSRSTLTKKEQPALRILAVNMFSLSTDVTTAEVFKSIQMSLSNCSSSLTHCRMVLQHQLSYRMESLCEAQRTRCDADRSTCTDGNGTANCQCLQGYYKLNPDDLSCLECRDGYKLENGTCVPCMFGFGGFNCGNFYKLIAVVVSPAGGAMLLILTIALIVTCCKKDKNDINKIIFKSGDMQMSPYADFPKNNRISMEWGRETIEMQENGSTKNLLQMTDIYYSPALRNSDLERNGLYPFTGLPGSRHSCIYPAQWNPSFTSDDSRRRDYF
uniref:Heart of glass n=1 Tax=Nothobranchius kadleci TaxID=1051664 RepID=A0A1A8E0Z0_NOTKA